MQESPPSADAAVPAPATRPRRRAPGRWGWGAGGVVLAILVALGICEAIGWPFLAAPVQRALAQTLDRPVRFGADAANPELRVRFLGHLRISAASLEIGAPRWSQSPYMLQARDAYLKLGYVDLWRAHGGAPLRIRELRAAQLDAHIERLPDGRATWQFGPKPKPDAEPAAFHVPNFDRLRIGVGTMTLRDAVMKTDLDAHFSLIDRSGAQLASDVGSLASGAQRATEPPAASAASPADVAAASAAASGLVVGQRTAVGAASQAQASLQSRRPDMRFEATGHYRGQPLAVSLNSQGVLAVFAEDADRVALPVTVDAKVGQARLRFVGTATDVIQLTALKGRFDVSGPSLAAIGDPLGVTLPTTGVFRAGGLIAKDGQVWHTVVEKAVIGSSELSGAFGYDAGRAVPLLSGRLNGTRLLLADLGPAVGTPPPTAAPSASAVAAVASAAGAGPAGAKPSAKAASAKTAPPAAQLRTNPSTPALPKAVAAAASAGAGAPPTRTRGAGKVLPDRSFDLPSLRAMDANVLVDIAMLDLGSDLLAPLRPLRGHLVLQNAVLTLDEIDARTAQGRMRGRVQLDGRQQHQALWNADLRWNDVRLEDWVKLANAQGRHYLTGRLNGQARVAGQGQSTAAILGSLNGGIRMQLADGTLSHLAVEAAGLDVAQALGVLIKGDDNLPIDCGVADLAVAKGSASPRVLVVDTPDSTVWTEGSLSFATEALDLRLQVSPKDFSPLALRTPVHVRGTFGDPHVSLEKGPLAKRVGAAALLALVNPLAAVLPFFDTGSGDDAKRGAQSCHALMERMRERPTLPAPPPPRAGARR